MIVHLEKARRAPTGRRAEDIIAAYQLPDQSAALLRSAAVTDAGKSRRHPHPPKGMRSMNLPGRKRNAEPQSPGDEIPAAEAATEEPAVTESEPEAPEEDAADEVAAGQDEPQAPEPLGDDASPGDMAAAAGQIRRAASAARERADRERAEASGRLVSARAAEAEATRARIHAEQMVRRLGGTPHPDDREAEALEGSARSLMAAAGAQSGVAEAAQRALDLNGERERLAGQVAEFGSRLGRLDGEHQAADGQLATARAADDIDAITALLSRIGAIEDQAAGIGAQRQAAVSRREAIGDGDGPGELAEALRAFASGRVDVRRTLNAVWPARQEAVQDKAAADARASAEAIAERMREEAAPKPGVPHTVVMTSRR